MMVWNWIDRTPRRVLALISLACVALLACGLYLQHVVGLVPCPMCIVQRYALIGLALLTGLASARSAKGWWLTLAALAALTAGVVVPGLCGPGPPPPPPAPPWLSVARAPRGRRRGPRPAPAGRLVPHLV